MHNCRHRGQMGVQNDGQQPGLWSRGTPVETQAGSATGRRDRRPAPRRRVQETPGPPLDAAEQSADIAGSRHI